jgi:hypothetical protein
MAKIEGPLMSIEAHGSIGPRLTFSSRKTGQQVRFQNRQVDVKSAGQIDQRKLFFLAKAAWHTLTSTQQENYNQITKSQNLNMTGYNYFINQTIKSADIETGLQGYWPFASESDGETPDESGHDRNGTVTGATLTTKDGKSCYYFPNSTDKIDLPTSVLQPGPAVAICFLAQTINYKANNIIWADDGSGNRIINIHLNYQNIKTYWDAGYSDGSFDRIYKSGPGNFGIWEHFVFQKNADLGIMEIWKNGSLWHSGENKKISFTVPDYVRIGYEDFSWDGYLSQFRIYNRMLNPATIQKLSNDAL